MKLGIIGTAGRKEDSFLLSKEVFRVMYQTAYDLIHKHQICECVSGGAAWADAVATRLFVNDSIPALTLHLPTKFEIKKSAFEETDCGRICNYYHRKFTNSISTTIPGFNSLNDIAKAVGKGATVSVGHGFHARNTSVATDSDYLLAMTYGEKELLKDGGTKDTMSKFILKKGDANTYHLDLFTFKLYQKARI
jgi:hypothetical protein